MREYEMMLILNPELDEEKRKEVLDKIESIIKEGKGETQEIKEWGLKELAYPIKKKNTGYYVLWYFKSPGNLPINLRRELKLVPDVYRVMIMRVENVVSEKRRKT
jgi:small subunit ribosomal protein S6